MSEPGILILMPNWVGDAALAAPALRALRLARPAARWILVGNARSAPLYGRWECDLLIVAGKKEREGTIGLARRLRRLSIQEALILPTSFRSALAPFMAAVGRRTGFSTDGRGLLLTHSLPRPRRETHLARQYLELAASLGADPAAPLDPTLPVGEDEVGAQVKRLGELGFAGDTTIALCPGATYGETKRWPVAHWIALGRLLRQQGRTLVVLGGGQEIGAGDLLVGEIGSGVENLAGKLSLRESLALLRVLRGAVSNDSGAMHLAAAAGCPILGLFGSTNPAWTGPLGERSRSLWLALPCSPCYAKSCPTQIECLRDMTPGRVGAELAGLMRGAGGEVDR
jgi:heptosyltransferase II